MYLSLVKKLIFESKCHFRAKFIFESKSHFCAKVIFVSNSFSSQKLNFVPKNLLIDEKSRSFRMKGVFLVFKNKNAVQDCSPKNNKISSSSWKMYAAVHFFLPIKFKRTGNRETFEETFDVRLWDSNFLDIKKFPQLFESTKIRHKIDLYVVCPWQ